MIDLLVAALASYAITFTVASSVLFSGFRDVANLNFRKRLGIRYPFWDCRMCVGFWISLAVGFLSGLSPLETLATYGGSYFLATQERIS